jgi:hypothetical protein
MITKKQAKIGARVRWTGQATIDYGTITHVDGKHFEVRWDQPDPDSGEDTFTYNTDERQSSVNLA